MPVHNRPQLRQPIGRIADGEPISGPRTAPSTPAPAAAPRGWSATGAATATATTPAQAKALVKQLLANPRADLSPLKNDKSPAMVAALADFILKEPGMSPLRGGTLQATEDARRDGDTLRMEAKSRALQCLGGRSDPASFKALTEVVQRGEAWGDRWGHALPIDAAELLAARTDPASTAAVRQELMGGLQTWGRPLKDDFLMDNVVQAFFKARPGGAYDGELVGALLGQMPKQSWQRLGPGDLDVLDALKAHATGKGDVAKAHLEQIRALQTRR